MAQTYTSQWFRVSNGDVTTHNAQSLVPTNNDIRILDAEIQWEGIDVEGTQTDFRQNEKTNNDAPNNYYVQLPSVPDGYSFDEHNVGATVEYTGSNNSVEVTVEFDTPWGEFTDTETLFANNPNFFSSPSTSTNYVGSSAGINVTGISESEFTMETVHETLGSTTETVIESTQDPRVTRDVSGDSGNLTLNDGETSLLYPLSGLAPNSEEFYHDVNGSGEARFRFRFDWEKTFPDAIKQLRLYDGDSDVTRLVALADPTDSQLEYNAIRGYVGQAGQVLAVDVTADGSDPSAITSHRIYHPIHGTLYPRYYDTVT